MPKCLKCKVVEIEVGYDICDNCRIPKQAKAEKPIDTYVKAVSKPVSKPKTKGKK